jgi:hypothetical protein
VLTPFKQSVGFQEKHAVATLHGNQMRLPLLSDSVHGVLNVFAFAVRAPTRAGKPLSFFKNKSALQTLGRYDHQFLSLSSYGTRNMGKMPIDLLLPDAHGPREISGTHLFFIQKLHDLLSYGLHVTPVLRGDNSAFAFLNFYEFISINIR